MIRIQKRACDVAQAKLDWQLFGRQHYPLLGDVALRYLCITNQIADSERANKENKRVHAKDRSSLTADAVDDLLYCQINLKLLSKDESGELDSAYDIYYSDDDDDKSAATSSDILDDDESVLSIASESSNSAASDASDEDGDGDKKLAAVEESPPEE